MIYGENLKLDFVALYYSTCTLSRQTVVLLDRESFFLSEFFQLTLLLITTYELNRLNRNRKLLISRGTGQGPESQAGRQTVRWLWWMVLGVETGREVWGRRIRIGFAKEQCKT